MQSEKWFTQREKTFMAIGKAGLWREVAIILKN
jgi:hypothetical protein